MISPKAFVLIMFLLFFILPYSNNTFAQDSPRFHQLDNKFKNYEITTIPSQELYNQLNTSSRNNEVILNLGNGMKWTMELELNPIFSDKYTMVYGNEVYGNPIKEGRVKPMVGKLKNIDDSKVSLSFNHNFIFGEIKIGLISYFIEPLSYHIKGESPDKFIYYSINDIIKDEDYQCGYEKYKDEMDKFIQKEDIPGTRMPGGCYLVQYAQAADWSMVVKHGGAIGVENHITGVINNVQNNWDNEFDDEILFDLVTFWISSCSTCDPWNPSTDPYDVLPSFSTWANNGGFGATHDVGSMWSNRTYINGIVGLAWVGTVCTSNRYNILRDFTSNANSLRVMTAHELGHNFSAGHDASGSNTIMAPSVNNSNTWSTASRTSIQVHYLSRWCLSSCNTTPPPVANFTYDVIDNCVVGQVQYTDQSTNVVTRLWSFPGGTPPTSTDANPLISYNNVGTYNATLTVTNSAGSDSRTINNVVTTNDIPDASYSYSVNGLQVNFTNTTTNATSYSWDFGDGNLSTQTNPTHTYLEDGFYNVVLTAYNDCGPSDFSDVIEIATPPSANFSASPVSGCGPLAVAFTDESSSNSIQWTWNFPGGNPPSAFVRHPNVIYNQPGLYSVTLTVANLQGSSTFVRQQYIEVLQNPTSSFTFVRNGLTVTFTNTSTNSTFYQWNFGDGNTSTLQNPVHTYASAGNYTVTLESSNDCGSIISTQNIIITLAPLASFTTANSPEGCTPHTVHFVNTSLNNPTSFLWSFEGGIPSTSNQQNPSVLYTSPGNFDVSLTVSNSLGSDTEEISNYVDIQAVPTANFTYQGSGLNYNFNGNLQNASSFIWDFGDGNQSTDQNPVHNFASEGTYTVELSAQNDCGETISSQQIIVLLAPSAMFSANILSGCTPLTVQFSDESTPNTSQWNWTFPGGTPSSSNLRHPTVVFNQPGSYDALLLASNAAGQDLHSESNFILTQIAPSPGFSISVVGPTVTLTNTGSGAAQTEWQIADNGLQTLTGNTVSYTFTENGSFSIRQIVSNDCGTNNMEQIVTINAYPVANFSGNSNGNCAPVSIIFNNTSQNGTSYSWIFENGVPGVSTETNPSVVFNQGGQNMISLTTTNQYGSNTTTQSITILEVPNAAFTFSSNALIINFMNQTNGSGNSYHWDFGDGRSNNETNPVHTYMSPGTYEVILTVTHQCGTVTTTQQVFIDNRTPVIGFGANVHNGCAPLEVQFMDGSTNVPESWNWTFEGGDPSISTEKNPVVMYNQEGTYSVRLSASNGFGTSELIEDDYIVVYGPPQADFEYTLVDGQLSTDYSGNLVSSYSWDFGDGTRSSGRTTTHNYTSSGNYTITLIVENSCGSDTITKDISVILTSVENHFVTNNIKIAPNPNDGYFFLIFEKMEGQQVSIEIFNMLGVNINRFNHLISVSQESLNMDLMNVPQGTYLVRIVNEKGVSIVKKINIIE